MKIEKPLWAVFLFLVLLTFRQTGLPQENQSPPPTITSYKQMLDARLDYLRQQPFDLDLFWEYMQLTSTPHPVTAYYQARLETYNFQSAVFFENNNLFGMKRALVRPTTATGTNRGHATYDHWTCSVDDYKLRYLYFTRNRQYTDYLAFLIETGYAEDDRYIHKLTLMKSN